MSTRSTTFRLTLRENCAIRDYCQIMDLTLAQFVEIAAMETVHRMGIFQPSDLVGRALSWKDAPLRKTESVQKKLVVSFSPPNFVLIEAVAKALGVTVALFVVGSSLRYIGNAKKQIGRAVSALADIELAAQYE